MNTSEILEAAKEADIDPHDMCEDPIIALNNLQRFAAIIEKRTIERQSEPVAWGCPGHPETFVSNNKKQNSGYQSMVFFSEPLFSFPPDKAQIEQSVAEAIANMCDAAIAPWEQRRHGTTEAEDKVLQIIEAIRSGEWKKFIPKGE